MAGAAAAGNNARSILELGMQAGTTDAQIDGLSHIAGGIGANRAGIGAAALAGNIRVIKLAREMAQPLAGYVNGTGAVQLYKALSDAKIKLERELSLLRSSFMGGKSVTGAEDHEDIRITYSLIEVINGAKAHFKTAAVWTGHGAESTAWEASLDRLEREERLNDLRERARK
jgi:hypothetical protein